MLWYLLLMRNVLTRTGPVHVHTPTQTHDFHSTAKLGAVIIAQNSVRIRNVTLYVDMLMVFTY